MCNAPSDGTAQDVHASAGCADTVDIGETAYASVLADDLDNDGRMDLVLSTMNGNLYCFHTGATYHPLQAWPTPVSSCRAIEYLTGCMPISVILGLLLLGGRA